MEKHHDFTRRAVLVSAIASGFAAFGMRASAATKKKTTTTVAKKKVTTQPGVLAIAATSELVISYTYSTDGGGRSHNPYVAVWIEDSAGMSLRTVHLELQQERNGRKYLSDLKRWFRSDETRQSKGGSDLVDTISSATRLPGTYAVSWDGKTDKGATVPAGEYFVCIESARERGPYELVREALALNGAAVSKKFADSGSLTGIGIELRPRA